MPPALQMGARSLIAALLVFLWCAAARQADVPGATARCWPGLVVGRALRAGVPAALLRPAAARPPRAASSSSISRPSSSRSADISALRRAARPRRSSSGLGAAFLGVVLAFSDSLVAAVARSAARRCALRRRGDRLGPDDRRSSRDRRCARAPAEKTLLYQLGVSALLGLGALARARRRGRSAASRSRSLPAFLYQAIWVAAITYVAWFALIRRLSGLAAFRLHVPDAALRRRLRRGAPERAAVAGPPRGASAGRRRHLSGEPQRRRRAGCRSAEVTHGDGATIRPAIRWRRRGG